jgi:VIT1/CCC1 family predicted Fe2+/Mn2+ transporter
VLFVVGAYKAKLTVGRPAKSGLEIMFIGMASALVGYAVGLLFTLG